LNNILISQLEKILINLGEDKFMLDSLHKTYEQEPIYAKTWKTMYYRHLKELHKKYYGRVK